MARSQLHSTLQLLHRVVEDQRVKDLRDNELLQRFVVARDAAAFQALLRRHGPMVLGVCRSMLPSEADAEDAFQATFLAFAQKARSIHQTSALGSWLHGVAYRTARKAQAMFAKRQKHERRASQRETSAPDDLTWREVQRVVHEELSELSERHRAPLTLCYLQGRTLDEAAVQLGLAKSTLKTRLERGRALLRARLVRRGLGPAAVLLASAWPASIRAAQPTGALHTTLRAALGVAAGQTAAGLVSNNVVTLMEGTRNAMLITKLKAVTVAVTLLALVGLTVGGMERTTAAAKPGPETAQQAPAPPAAAPQSSAEQQAVAALQAVGGRIIRDKTKPGEPVVAVYLLSRQVTDRDLKHLRELKSLKSLVLPGITDASIKELRELKSLQYLRARSSHIKGSLKDLGELTELRELDLDGFEETALQDLRGLQSLRALTISPWRSTDHGLKELKTLKELGRLELAYVFDSPQEARNLEAGLRELSELPDLEELVLKVGRLDDAGLKQVAKLKNLRRLRIQNNQVTDAGLAELRSLTKLRSLFILNTRITDAGVADLKKALHDLVVTKDVSDQHSRTWDQFERITGRAKVIDAKTLLFDDGTRIPLNMAAPTPGEKGAAEAAEFLAQLIRDRKVTCYLVEAQLAYLGYADEVNLEHTMIINGWARSGHSSTEAAESIARENKRGLWSGKFGEPAP
jgi:RNA polymerase sigma factor (sigma-70 family)